VRGLGRGRIAALVSRGLTTPDRVAAAAQADVQRLVTKPVADRLRRQAQETIAAREAAMQEGEDGSSDEPPGSLESPEYAFEWAGDFWDLTFAGRTAHVKDGIGPRYLAMLLANPRKPLYCPDMIAVAQGNPIMKVSDLKDPVADREAFQQYERHLADLASELEEAKDWNDLARQERLQAQIADLTERVARMRGLGGRARTFSDPAEQARVSVTKAVNRLLTSDAVAARLPEAARHLEKSISCGTFVCYDPETPVDWELSVRRI